MKLVLPFFLVFVLALATTSHAQIRPELASLVQAEKGFAQMSVDENIRAAFVGNFDDQTIAFQNGEPLPGRKGWLAREPNDGYLFWWPIWADVSSSGDFGFTTGPVEFGGTRLERKPTGGQYFASVWRKNSEGAWKVVADLGSAMYDPAEQRKEFNSPKYTPVKAGKTVDIAGERSGLLQVDKKYVTDLSEARTSFDARQFAPDAWMHRRGQRPLTNLTEIKAFQEKGEFTLEQVGGDVASSCDMGFTYGRVKALVIRDGKETVVPTCYMRVWKKEGGAWKIVLDVIGG